MTYHYLVFWGIIVAETCYSIMLTDIKKLNLEAVENPVTLKTSNKFSEKNYGVKNENIILPYYLDPESITAENRLTKICTQISHFIKANLEHISGNFCAVKYPDSDDSILISVITIELPGFWKHFTKSKTRHPLRVVIRGQYKGFYKKSIEDIVFYDEIREEVYFETRFGPLYRMRELAKKSGTLPDNKMLFDYLNKKAEKHRNMEYNTSREEDLALRDIVCTYMGLHMGAIHMQQERGGSCYFLLPVLGHKIQIYLPVLRSNIEEILGLHFGRTRYNPLYVYQLRYVYSESEIGYENVGRYPEDTYFYEVKYRTHGTLEDFSSRYETLRKILK